jgi:hypothetical protein
MRPAARRFGLRLAFGRLDQTDVALVIAADDIGLRLGCRILRHGLLALVALTPTRPLGAVAVAILLTITVEALLLLAPRVLFLLRLAQQAQVMFCMLLEILGRNPVTRQLRIARQLVVFLNDLLRCAAHLALWAGAVKHAIDNVPDGSIAVRLVPLT